MLGYLAGTLLDFSETTVTVGVGSPGSLVGYLVAVPSSFFKLERVQGAALEFHVYTHVREDQLDLYGFETKVEKELFVSLMKCNGVGPKAALSILSGAPVDTIVGAIIDGDTALLTTIPGIGKKIAERLSLELRDDFQRKRDSGGLRTIKSDRTEAERSSMGEARAALLALGFRPGDVEAALQKSGKTGTVKDLIKQSLRELSPT
jgi:Holliday junction DNA helicase RuvA